MKLIAPLALLCLSSCGLGLYTTVCVQLPPPPPCWPEKLSTCGYVLRYLREPGNIEEIVIPPDTTEARIRIRKLPAVPVSAVPVYGSPPASLRACGAVFPDEDDSSGVLKLTWEDGFLAGVLLRCASVSRAVQAVNITKLKREIRKRTDGNPWLLDPGALESAIVDEKLTSRSLKLLPCRDIALDAAPGRWISGNPLLPLPAVCDGTLALNAIPEGIHTYFLLRGEERIDISVTAEGWTAICPARGTGTSVRL